MKPSAMCRVDAGARPWDRVIYDTELVRVGSFRAATSDPWFHDSGPIDAPIFVFPRTSVVIHHEDRDPFTTDTCTVTYYNEGQRYSRRPVDPRGDVCEWFSVRPDVIEEVLTAHDPGVAERAGRPFVHARGPSDAPSYALQRRVVRYVEDPDAADRLGVEEAVLTVLARLVGLLYGAVGPTEPASHAKDRRPPGAALAESVRAFLLEQFTAPCNLDEIARAVGASVYHMCRVFRAETGTTVHQYRHQLRLRRSLELVAEGGRDLSRIAFELGFSSHSHFSAAFRDAFATTPSEFRRRASASRVREATLRLRERTGASW